MEWDIWNAIVNRERNYGKKENKKIRINKRLVKMDTLYRNICEHTMK